MPVIVTAVYLIRHAHAEWNESEARPLSSSGQTSAGRLADALAARPIIAIYSSPFRRSIETVTPLAERLGLHVEVLHDLRERRLPIVPAAEFSGLVESAWRSPSVAPPGGEANVVAQARGRAAVQQIIDRHPGQHVVVATHGNLLMLMLNSFNPGFGYESWRKLSLPDVFQLEFEGTTFRQARRIWEPLASEAG
jgi:2,3-bisphosphoglycerate-dependent phosphoglycerate mutase